MRILPVCAALGVLVPQWAAAQDVLITEVHPNPPGSGTEVA